MIVFAFLQLPVILAVTTAVPSIVGNGMSQSAALLVQVLELLFIFCSPSLRALFSSILHLHSSMLAAFGGALSTAAGYTGILIGAIFTGLVYVVTAIVVKIAGVNWINKLMFPFLSHLQLLLSVFRLQEIR